MDKESLERLAPVIQRVDHLAQEVIHILALDRLPSNLLLITQPVMADISRCKLILWQYPTEQPRDAPKVGLHPVRYPHS